jgi:hypothetical protein
MAMPEVSPNVWTKTLLLTIVLSPSCPNWFHPAQKTAPKLVTMHVWYMPALTLSTVAPPTA